MVKIWIKNPQKILKLDLKKIREIAKTVFISEVKEKSAEFSLYFVNDKLMREYNLKYHKSDYSTDVLSFSLSNSLENIIGEIIISVDTAKYHSRIFKTNPIYETYLYVIHGILHILGYDDLTPKDKRIMRKKEKFYLSLLKL